MKIPSLPNPPLWTRVDSAFTLSAKTSLVPQNVLSMFMAQAAPPHTLFPRKHVRGVCHVSLLGLTPSFCHPLRGVVILLLWGPGMISFWMMEKYCKLMILNHRQSHWPNSGHVTQHSPICWKPQVRDLHHDSVIRFLPGTLQFATKSSECHNNNLDDQNVGPLALTCVA